MIGASLLKQLKEKNPELEMILWDTERHDDLQGYLRGAVLEDHWPGGDVIDVRGRKDWKDIDDGGGKMIIMDPGQD
jgi:hypothetical protein